MNRVPIADLYPELIEGIAEDRRHAARHQLTAPVERLAIGPWAPGPRHATGVGVLIVGGLLMRDVVLSETVATEIVGRGDILRPSEHDGADAPVPFSVEWHVIQPTTTALLDDAFAAALAQWPQAIEAIVAAPARSRMRSPSCAR